MMLADWSTRLLIEAPTAAIALPTGGQPTEDVERFVAQLAKRLERATGSAGNMAVIQVIRRAQFEALSLTAELYLWTLHRSGDFLPAPLEGMNRAGHPCGRRNDNVRTLKTGFNVVASRR